MAANTISYQRLKHDSWFDESEEVYDLREKVVGGLIRRSRFRRSFHVKRRLRVKIPNFFRRKAKLVRTAWTKVCRRLKESQSHFGDLFAGNYLVMQVTPTAFKYGINHNNNNNNNNNNNKSFGKNDTPNNYGVHRLPSIPTYV